MRGKLWTCEKVISTFFFLSQEKFYWHKIWRIFNKCIFNMLVNFYEIMACTHTSMMSHNLLFYTHFNLPLKSHTDSVCCYGRLWEIYCSTVDSKKFDMLYEFLSCELWGIESTWTWEINNLHMKNFNEFRDKNVKIFLQYSSKDLKSTLELSS